MTSLANKTIIGVLWNLSEQLLKKGISIFVTLLLAHLLSPEDFGLVAMITVFVAIASAITDSGLRQALIRMPNITKKDYNTAFYANIILGVLAYCLLFLLAPLVAEFYDEERLSLLLRLAGSVVIFNSFQSVPYACLSRLLDFKSQLRAALPAGILSAVVSVTMAYLGWGVWSLVAQMVSAAFFVTLFLLLQKIWTPSWCFSISSLKSMYSFSYKLLLSGLLDISFRNMYVIVIAKLFTTTLAGLYFFADRIREILIYQLVGSVQKVVYPALSTVQNDPQRLKMGYKKVISISAFILFPIILFFAALAEPIFHVFLPEKWWPSISYIQLMCVASVLIPVHSVNFNMLKVLGRSDLVLGVEVAKKTVAVSILLFSYQYGVIGVLIGQIISSVLTYIPYCYYSHKLIDYSAKEQIQDFFPNLSLTLLIASFVWIVQSSLQWTALFEILTLGTLSMLLYFIAGKALRISGYEIACTLLKQKIIDRTRA